MLINIFVILGVLLLAWIWGARGLFSALLHLACVIVAGAIAFAVWEPASHAILGTDQQWLIDMAWGLGLAVPFALVLAIIRVTCDKLIPANVDVDTVTNFVGGGICGAISGVLMMGILTLSLSYSRLGTEAMGYRTAEYDVSGSLIRKSALWVPVDRMTAGFYSLLSATTYRPMIGEPLAVWHPELAYEGGLLRTNYDEGNSRSAMPPEYYEVVGRYTVAKANQGENVFKDSFGPERGERTSVVKYLNDESASPAQTYIDAFVIRLTAKAREPFGSTVLGNSQVWLLVEHEQQPGTTKMILPFAMISRAKGETDQLGRWLFNRPDVFIPSVGGQSETVFAFEFAVPRGWRPIALSVKGARKDVRQMQAGSEYASVAERDAAVREGSIITVTSKVDLDWSRAEQVRIESVSGTMAAIRTGNHFPGRMAVQKDRKQGLQINDQNEIVSGEQKFAADELLNMAGVEQSLLIRRFFAGPNTGIVQVDVSHSNPTLSLTRHPVLSSLSQDVGKPLRLVDTLGRAYEPIGYVYTSKSKNEIWIRFTPGSPIQKISDLPRGGPATVNPTDEYVLLYRIPAGVQIRGLAIGDVVGAEFRPPVDVLQPR